MAVKSEIRSLTGLRGLAAMFVAVFHFSQNGAFFSFQDDTGGVARMAGTLIGHGYLCVDLFFVLSGFVMALTYGKMFENGHTWPQYRLFLLRRFARIYPIYLVLTLATAAMLSVHATPPALGFTLLTNILMVQGWGLADSLNGPAWSISTEWCAYLVFPFLVLVTVFAGRRVFLLAAFVAVGTLCTIALLPTRYVVGRVGPLDAHDCTTLLPLARCIGGFTIGLLSYRVAGFATVSRWARYPGAPLALLLAIVLLLTLPGTDVAAVLLFPLLIITLSTDNGWTSRVMGGRVLHTLGILSYSLYLLHFRFMWADRQLRDHLPKQWSFDVRQVVAFIAVFALLIACSALTYIAIEKPCRSLFRSPRMPTLFRRRTGSAQT